MQLWVVVGFILIVVISLTLMVLTEIFYPVVSITNKRHLKNPFSRTK
jgi:hypothetical protein